MEMETWENGFGITKVNARMPGQMQHKHPSPYPTICHTTRFQLPRYYESILETVTFEPIFTKSRISSTRHRILLRVGIYIKISRMEVAI